MVKSKGQMKKDKGKPKASIGMLDQTKNVVDKKIGGNNLDDPFTIRIINTITYQQTKLTITKKFKLKDIHEAYSPFEAHPEYYLWQDMFGRNLELDKTVVENRLVDSEEMVEFDGIGKQPVIILIFRDGFEDQIPPTLNPLKRNWKKDPQLCRNY